MKEYVYYSLLFDEFLVLETYPTQEANIGDEYSMFVNFRDGGMEFKLDNVIYLGVL